ncbi:hypothetical protein SBV1_270025 [Verrucomicrobia bacterium]|nr:hypothetical protein SBV1_270025 [Verrucomicrobiota bacterium]
MNAKSLKGTGSFQKLNCQFGEETARYMVGGQKSPPTETKTGPCASTKTTNKQEKIMKQTRTQDISTQTLAGPAPAPGATVAPVRRGWVFDGGLWPKTGILAALLALPLGAGLLRAGETHDQPRYRFIEIPVPGPSYAFGINDNRTVTGFYTDPTTGDVLSYVIERGELTTGISAPGATITSLGPANNRGVESGNFGDETNQQAGFYDIRRGTFTTLPEIPGLPFSFGNGINDFGHGSGVSYASGDFYNGGNGLGQNWIWDGENYSFYTVPGAVNGAEAGGINNRDQVSGLYLDSSGLPKGFVKDGTNFTTLAVPGATYTVAYGINDRGVVAGTYLIAPHGHHGFVWSEGTFITVDDNSADSAGTGWYGLNEHGDLAGFYFDTTNHVAHALIGLRKDGDEDRDH